MRLHFHSSTHQAGNETLSLLNLTLNQGNAALAGFESLFAAPMTNSTGLWPVGDTHPDQWQTDFSLLLSQLQQQAATPQTTLIAVPDSTDSTAVSSAVMPNSESVASAIHSSATPQIAHSLEPIVDQTAFQFPMPVQWAPQQSGPPTPSAFTHRHPLHVLKGSPSTHSPALGQVIPEETAGTHSADSTEIPPLESGELTLDRLLLTQSIPIPVRITLTPTVNQPGLSALMETDASPQPEEIPDEVFAQVLNTFPQQLPIPSQLRDLGQFDYATLAEHVDPPAQLTVHAHPVTDRDSLLNPIPFGFTANPSQIEIQTRPTIDESSQSVPDAASSDGSHGVGTLPVNGITADHRTLDGELPPTSPQIARLPEDQFQSRSAAAIATKIESTFDQTLNAETATEEVTESQQPTQTQTQQHLTAPVSTVPTQTAHADRLSDQLNPEQQGSTGEADRQFPSSATQSTLPTPLTERASPDKTAVASNVVNGQDQIPTEPEPQIAQTILEAATHLTQQTKSTGHRPESHNSEFVAQSTLSSTVVSSTPITQSERQGNPVAASPSLVSITGEPGGGSAEFQSSTDDRRSSTPSDRVASRTDGAVETSAQTAAPIEQTFSNQLQSATLSNLQSSLTEQITQQLVQQINLTDAEGVQKFQIRLDPEELGGMVIEIHRNEKGELQIHVSADSPETRAMVENQTRQISSSLQNQGVALTEFHVLQQGTESFGESPHQQRHRAEVDEPGHETTAQIASKAASSVTENASGEISFRA